MDKLKLKKAIIDLEKHLLEDAHTNYDEYVEGNILQPEEVADADAQSHHHESAEVTESLDRQIIEHEEHLQIINEYAFEETDEVQPGAVVKLNGRYMVVCVPLSKFDFEGEKFIGISTKAPIYPSMEGKKQGDSFTFNDRKFKIEEVH